MSALAQLAAAASAINNHAQRRIEHYVRTSRSFAANRDANAIAALLAAINALPCECGHRAELHGMLGCIASPFPTGDPQCTCAALVIDVEVLR